VTLRIGSSATFAAAALGQVNTSSLILPFSARWIRHDWELAALQTRRRWARASGRMDRSNDERRSERLPLAPIASAKVSSQTRPIARHFLNSARWSTLIRCS